MTISLIRGNALTIPLADQSVHLIVTSPPYFALRSYRDDDEHFDGQLGSEETPLHFLAALWAVMDECWRVLRDDGSCWVNLGDKLSGSGGNNNAGVGGSKRGPSSYNKATGGLLPKSRMMLPHLFAEGCQYLWLRRAIEIEAGLTPTVEPRQWICRMDAVWSKVNGLPESVTDRVRASHENWFHFAKSGRYYAALDEIREDAINPRSFDNAKYAGKIVDGKHNSNRNDEGAGNWGVNPLGKLPGSVWQVATEPLTLPEFMVPEYPGQLEPRWVMNRKDAWRWMRDTGIDTSPWPQQPEDGKQLRAAPSHFAAFPSYFPKRIIAGWSPSGVCTVCGEGRRPVCEKGYQPTQATNSPGRIELNGDNNFTQSDRPFGRARSEASITGYACACLTPTAPTTPARILDPFSGTGTTSIVADALGRHGIGVDLSWDYVRIARYRSEDRKLRAKVQGRPPPKESRPPQAHSLFDGLDLSSR